MSKVFVYCVFDRIAEERGPLFEAKSDPVAIRNFKSMGAKEGINLEDYMLLKVAEADTEGLMEIKAIQPPVTLSEKDAVGELHPELFEGK